MKLFAGICATALLVYAAPAWAESHTNGNHEGQSEKAGHHENGDNENENKGQSDTGACASAYGQAQADAAHAKNRDQKSKGKSKGEKGGTEDINIGVGELQEDCMDQGAYGDKQKGDHGDHDNDDYDDDDNDNEEYDGKVGVGDLQACIAEAMAGGNLENAKETCQERMKEEAKTRAQGHSGDDDDDDGEEN